MTMEQITTGITDLMTVMGTVLTSIGANAALMVIFCVGVVGAGASAFKKIARSVKQWKGVSTYENDSYNTGCN